jgi:hypothetical protein
VFRSFFLGGFEGSMGQNKSRQWFDGVSRTQHDRFLDEDYALLTSNDIYAVRECVRWPLVDTGRDFDFSTLDALIEAGRRAGITTIYDLFHFGYPPSLDLLSKEFPKRFAEYCYRVARRVSSQCEGTCYFTPVNEPSYFAWAGGEVGLFAPHLCRTGQDVKIALIRAAILGIEAMWAASPLARMVSVDPFCRIVPANSGYPEVERAEEFNSKAVFESWDMLAGRLMPELGGSLRHLDIVGVNYYPNNQWIMDETWATLTPDDPRRMPLRHIARTVWNRYGREIIFTETSAVGDERPSWIKEIVSETEAMQALHIPVAGVCWYPVLEMPEWHNSATWTTMGLWDLDHKNGSMRRIPYKPALRALREAQLRLKAGGRSWKISA